MEETKKRRIQPFDRIRAWQESRALTKELYLVTAKFPKEEMFGITSQIRRASASTMANIAEGSRRETNRDYAHFLNIAEGSMAEVQSFLVLAADLGYLGEDESKKLIAMANTIIGMLYRLRQCLDE